MQTKLVELRAHWTSLGDRWPEIVHEMKMRIGINSGDIVTGNMGSAKRMNYTMMGDSVNLAPDLKKLPNNMESTFNYLSLQKISYLTQRSLF